MNQKCKVIYMKKEIETFAIFDAKVSTWGKLPDPYVSDHLAVTASLGYKEKTNGLPVIPSFVAKHPLFSKKVDSICESFSFSPCAFARLEELKEIFREAFSDFKNNCKFCPATDNAFPFSHPTILKRLCF